ncbi:DUF5995 family protein [Actinomycetospora chibensis]|uniref:DUF5995 family protein n=1 Tax=Actinomycetospora chibensis TaxID=663606 RepID=A0ABV9RT97_9PSEU|nr:DUF5995 family protein [Actinomycetospora chibensis]MDD7927460.1 DUF5995 family protein [Actinomycetospora chibensis]
MPDAPDENKRRLAPLAARRPTTVPEVVDLLREIRDVADDLEGKGKGHRDGIACFSDLYHTITSDVLARYEARDLFRCGDFIYRLDLAFAQRYLDALHAWLGGRPTPACWSILFDRRQDDSAEWCFSVVGVNAHVNFDLTFALLDVWEANPGRWPDLRHQRADYLAINRIFHERMDHLCEENGTPWTRWEELFPDGGWLDRLANRGGDMIVLRTRDEAWDKAEELWPSRERDGYRDVMSETLDEKAEFIAKIFI